MTNSTSRTSKHVFDLARFHGVQTSFIDAFGKRQNVNLDALLVVLDGLNVGLENVDEAAGLLADGRLEKWNFSIDPVIVAWDGLPPPLQFRVPASASGRLICHLSLEDGGDREWVESLDALQIESGHEVAGQAFVTRLIPLPEVPRGYHSLRLELGNKDWECLLIAAPKRAYEPASKHWGVFAPLYALHSEHSLGIGDVSDLKRFAEWVDLKGGDFVATLPLLPMFIEGELYSPSPYSPVSRLFWNELYVDAVAAAEASGNTSATARLANPATQDRLERLRASPDIDYRGVYELKREILNLLASDSRQPRQEASSLLEEYARFRAVHERQQRPWSQWPDRLKKGAFAEGDYDPAAVSFYTTGQQIIDEQLSKLSSEMAARHQQFYLDLPIGSHADGFDTWKYQSLFAQTAQCGAPPDALISRGQAWGLPPMIPQVMRSSKYEYFRAVLRHHLRLADIVRIDHVIGLHRLYWVPDGFSARQGIFVQYPAEELYAILCLESHRSQTVIVGENLGTVPKHINAMMGRHGIYETYVLEYEIPAEAKRIRPAPRRSFAGLNTHDMPTFAGFLNGVDLTAQESLGIRDHESVIEGMAERSRQMEVLCAELESRHLLEPGDRDAGHLLNACLALLTTGPAKYVVINLEDLWLEVEGHNLPGTISGNWVRRSKWAMDELPDLPG